MKRAYNININQSCFNSGSEGFREQYLHLSINPFIKLYGLWGCSDVLLHQSRKTIRNEYTGAKKIKFDYFIPPIKYMLVQQKGKDFATFLFAIFLYNESVIIDKG